MIPMSPKAFDENLEIIKEGEILKWVKYINGKLKEGKTTFKVLDDVDYFALDDVKKLYKEAGWSNMKVNGCFVRMIKPL